MKLYLFNIANFHADGGAMFGVVPKVLWSRYYNSDENNFINLSLRSLLIETKGRIILVDNGWGDKQDEKFFRHVNMHGGEGLIDGLKKRGYNPGDITDVLITHLHADHCGGGVKRNAGRTGFELTFPDATYHVSRTQWDWAAKNNLREADSFLEENIFPMAESGHLNLVDEEGELFEGVSVRFFYGHTPGLMIPVVRYNGYIFFYAGDLIPTASHVPLVWNTSYDLDPLRTIDEKDRVLKEALEGNYIIIFQHDEFVECGNLKMTPKGIRLKESLNFPVTY
jgi:glyoxylase-like metal-dependent hydrolase (beta-lactamase superfamily II)